MKTVSYLIVLMCLIWPAFSGKDKNSHSPETVLLDAAMREDIAVIRMVLHGDVDLGITDEKGKTPLYYVVDMGGGEALVKLLLEKGADPNVTDKEGRSPLHYAVEKREYEMVRALLDAGAKPNAVDNVKRTPLHLIQYHRYSKITKMLLDAGANPKAVDWYGFTPLHFVESMKDGEAARMLLDRGADPNATTNGNGLVAGLTPLHVIAYNYASSSESVKVLLEQGADPNAVDKRGKSPIERAKYNINAKILLEFFNKGVNEHDAKEILNFLSKERNYVLADLFIRAIAQSTHKNGKGPLVERILSDPGLVSAVAKDLERFMDEENYRHDFKNNLLTPEMDKAMKEIFKLPEFTRHCDTLLSAIPGKVACEPDKGENTVICIGEEYVLDESGFIESTMDWLSELWPSWERTEEITSIVENVKSSIINGCQASGKIACYSTSLYEISKVKCDNGKTYSNSKLGGVVDNISRGKVKEEREDGKQNPSLYKGILGR